MRKDAPGHPPGFSLVELLSAVAVAAILLGLALPGFQETLRRQRAGWERCNVLLAPPPQFCIREAEYKGGKGVHRGPNAPARTSVDTSESCLVSVC